jgi:molybdopterin/thiamine biosynthesis adenylyltransferase
MQKIINGVRMEIPDSGTTKTLLGNLGKPPDSVVYEPTERGEHRVLSEGESIASIQGEHVGIISRFRTGMRDDGEELKARLVMKETNFDRLRSHLFQADGKERAAFALVGKAELEKYVELYVHRLILPEDQDYCEQSAVVVEPKPEFVLETMAGFASTRVPGFFHIHSHPFCPHASFSSIDTHYFPGIVRSLKHYLILSGKEKDFFFTAVAWGQSENGFTTRCFAPDGSLYTTVEEIKVVGKHGIRLIRQFSNPDGREETEPLSGRFQRQVEFLGESGQRRIQDTHLAVCGAGGLGSFVVACAKGLGFKEITLIDPDILEESNLNRFQGATRSDVGRPKVDVVAEAIKLFDPDIKVNPVNARVEDASARDAILPADFVINCLDDDGARIEVQIMAALYLKPFLDLGAGIILQEGTRVVREMGGQAVLYFPGGPCLFCQGIDATSIVSREIRQVQRAAGYIQGTNETPPSVVTINAIMAGLGLQVAINYLTGFAEASAYLHYDALHNRSTELNFTSRSDCPICGSHGIEGRGDDTMEVSLGRSGKISLPRASMTPLKEPGSSSAGVPLESTCTSVSHGMKAVVRAKMTRISNWLWREYHAASQR